MTRIRIAGRNSASSATEGIQIKIIPEGLDCPFTRVAIDPPEKEQSSSETGFQLYDLDINLNGATYEEVVYDEPNNDSRFLQLREELNELANLSKGWNSYDTAPPNTNSIGWAEKVFDILFKLDFEPYTIVPSAEGGVGFVFTSEGKYADIECFNDGDLAAVYYDEQTAPHSWDIPLDDLSIEEAINKIRTFLNA